MQHDDGIQFESEALSTPCHEPLQLGSSLGGSLRQAAAAADKKVE